jgi:hypothetical protein
VKRLALAVMLFLPSVSHSTVAFVASSAVSLGNAAPSSVGGAAITFTSLSGAASIKSGQWAVMVIGFGNGTNPDGRGVTNVKDNGGNVWSAAVSAGSSSAKLPIFIWTTNATADATNVTIFNGPTTVVGGQKPEVAFLTQYTGVFSANNGASSQVNASAGVTIAPSISANDFFVGGGFSNNHTLTTTLGTLRATLATNSGPQTTVGDDLDVTRASDGAVSLAVGHAATSASYSVAGVELGGNSPTPTNTFTNTATNTATATFTSTATNTPTNTPTNTNTFTMTATNTPTNSATNTPTNTFTPTPTPTNTPTDTPTNTPTDTATNTATPTDYYVEEPRVWSMYKPTNTPTPEAPAYMAQMLRPKRFILNAQAFRE